MYDVLETVSGPGCTLFDTVIQKNDCQASMSDRNYLSESIYSLNPDDKKSRLIYFLSEIDE